MTKESKVPVKSRFGAHGTVAAVHIDGNVVKEGAWVELNAPVHSGGGGITAVNSAGWRRLHVLQGGDSHV